MFLSLKYHLNVFACAYLGMLGIHAANSVSSKRRSFALITVSSVNDWSTLHTRGLPRRLDAKTFRGDVSERIQVRSNSSPYTFDWFISCADFSLSCWRQGEGRKIDRVFCMFFDN